MTGTLRFSLVVPLYDEQDNVEALLAEVADVVVPLGNCEVICVDDASTDATRERLREFKSAHRASWLRILPMARNGGQSAAVLAGVLHARADIVLAMDGDMQNDPRDFAKMLDLLESGDADGVTGIRVNRKDAFVRRVSSRIGNGVRNWVTGDRVRDAACGIKAFRRELFLAAPRFSGMHRFMATLARYAGGKVTEIPVNHRARHAGRAKYGIGNRALRGLKDCLAVRWYRKRMLRTETLEEL